MTEPPTTALDSTASASTAPASTVQAGRRDGLRLDIGRITLDGYSPAQRAGFAASIQARLAGHGVPAAAARQAAEEILAAVDARLAGTE
jgi:hypothetical protein